MNEPLGHVDPAKFDALFDWMCAGARPSANAQTIIATMCERLVELGVPVSRFALFVFTLHPVTRGRRFVWQPDTGVIMSEAPHQIAETPGFKASAAYSVMTTGEGLRLRFAEHDGPMPHGDLDELREDGATDYLIEPLEYTTGETHAASWTTTDPAGFSDAAIAALKRLALPLARLTETYIVRLNAANILSAYVGRGAGERIMEGHIQRGDVETIEAVILFTDIKGFTRLSNDAPVDTVIDVLNTFFDQLVPAIDRHGGEVLKFLGDGLLAIFPTVMGPDGAAAGLGALSEAHRNLMAVDRERKEAGVPPIEYRASFHVGSVQFGNIGARHRVDFTAIGPTVNLGARLLQVASERDEDWVCSATFAALAPWPRRPLGSFALKGFADEQAVYALEPPSEDASAES